MAGNAPTLISTASCVKDNIKWMLPDTYSNITKTAFTLSTSNCTPPAPLDNPWTNPANAYSDNGSYATAYWELADYQYHHWYDFDLYSLIPAGSTINGIEVVVEAKSAGTGALWAWLIKNPLSSEVISDKKYTPYLTGADTVYTLGGANDLWGTTWDKDDFEDTSATHSFGIRLSGNSADCTYSVDYIKVRVYYSITDTSPYVYCYGDAGKFSKIDANDVPTFIGSVSNSHGNGLGFYKDSLIYIKDTCIGLCNDPYATTPTFRDTAIANGIRDYIYHPVAIGADQKCYVANSYQLGRFSDVDTTDWDGDILTFPNQYRIVALANNGFYLVMGLNNAGAIKSQGVVAYWDMVSNQVNRWYPLPEEDKIWHIFHNGSWDYIVCGEKIYRSNFDTPPEIWFYRTDIANAEQNGHIVALWKGGMIWAGEQEINYHGAETSLLEPVVHQPWYLAGITKITSLFAKLTELKLYVAGNTNQLYKIATTNDALTSVIATTPFIDLGRYWKLHYLKVVTEPLASGDSLTLSLISANGGTEMLDATTFTYSADGAKTTKNFSISGRIVNQFQLAATFTAGDVKIKSIEIYGEAMSELFTE